MKQIKNLKFLLFIFETFAGYYLLFDAVRTPTHTFCLYAPHN